MGATWGNNDRGPRPVPDGGTPWTRTEVLGVAVLLVLGFVVGWWVMWAAGNRSQHHLDRLCADGSTYACAADGRTP